MPGNVRGPKDMAQQLVALLDEHQEEIADAWLVAICAQMADSRYGQRPPNEIRANNLVALAMLRDLLQGSAPDTVWERRADLRLSLEYVKLGIDISEFVMAALLLESVTHPLLMRTFSPDAAEAQPARLELRHYVHLLARDIVRGYAETASQHLREEQQRTALLLEMTRAAGGSLDLDKVLRHAAGGIAAAVGAQHCLIFLIGDDAQSGVFWAVTDELPPTIAEGMRQWWARSHSLSDLHLGRLVAESKQPLACYDAQSDPGTDHQLMAALGVRSILEVPFVLRGRVLAVAIVATFDECRGFTEEQIELAMGIASTVAPAIENARLYGRVEELVILEERARLAREIHDEVAQILGVLQLKTSLLDDLLIHDKADHARALLPELQDLITKAYSGLRESIFDLRAVSYPVSGLLPALQEYLADYRLHYDLDVTLEADAGAATLLDGNTSVQVIRIVQEALTNARRHARASRARVRIEKQGEWLCISVEDDGRGFDSSMAFSAEQPHFGLQVMRERAEKARGNLAVDSCPGQGTKVELRLPCAPGGGQP